MEKNLLNIGLPLADDELPPIVRELVSNAPENFRMPTFIACMAPLGCLATRLRFRYPFDQDPSAVLLQVIICSEQSGGKSFARAIESEIMARQKERDNEQRRLEQSFNENRKNKKGKEIPEKPKTVIVCCPVNISIAKLVYRADAPVRHFGAPLTLWTFTDELGTATDSNRRAFANIKSILRTAYDLGSEYGIDYLSRASYSATVDLLYNTMYCSTPAVLDEYMDLKAIESGSVSRVILCDLNVQIGDDAPVFRKITPEQHSTIDCFIRRMMSDTYTDDGNIKPEKHIDMSWLDDDVRNWCEGKKNLALKTGSYALSTFYKRSSKSAQRISALCYYLYMLESEHKGNTERDSLLCSQARARKIYYCMAEQILGAMMDKWSRRYELLKSKNKQEDKPIISLFDTLPDEFTRQELKDNIRELGLSTEHWVFVSKWKKRDFIEEIGTDKFRKKSVKP